MEDIYDEFSYGILSPQGIKDFLSYTYQNWVSPAPQYVLLVGDSAYDPKDNYGLGTINYVPTYLAQTPFMGESLTDEWYVRISGNDAIADMDIGRLPASTTAQAETMVNKIISYENTPVLKTWERNTLLVADNQVEGYEVLFELMNEDVAGLVPAGMNSPFREYLNDYVDPSGSDPVHEEQAERGWGIDHGTTVVMHRCRCGRVRASSAQGMWRD